MLKNLKLTYDEKIVSVLETKIEQQQRIKYRILDKLKDLTTKIETGEELPEKEQDLFQFSIMRKVIYLKDEAIKNYLWDAASSLRSIENNFKGQYLGEVEIQLEPTLKNFRYLLSIYINKKNIDIDSKNFLIAILRDLTIENILDK